MAALFSPNRPNPLNPSSLLPMRNFFKTALATFVGLMLFTTVGLGGLAVLMISILTASRDTGPAVEDESVLVFDLSVNIVDGPTADGGLMFADPLTGQASSPTIALRTVLESLKAAAEDDRIAGLYLSGSISPGGAGLATLKEVREALEIFQQSGKPILAYDMGWSEGEYYLTSIADTVALNPAGLLELNGFSFETTFFAGALEKYGVGMQIVRAGTYKSAVEPFIRADNSPEEEEQIENLLADLWQDFLTTASASRNLQPSDLQSIANQSGLLQPQDALSAGLIDRVAYFDEVLIDLRQITGQAESDEDPESFRQISLAAYGAATRRDWERPSADSRIAVVYAEGTIVGGEGDLGQIGGDQFARQLRELRLDDDVKAILLRINSPGGSAAASDVIAREVFLAREAKPVIVSMGSLAASGGYLMATYANEIWASPSTITGSIGVYGLLPNIQDIANENGITWDIVKTGEFADIQTVTRPKTPEELAVNQRFVDQTYGQFLDSVADSRPISRQQVAEVAQGRVWSGTEAQTLGLVDQIGGLEAAIQSAAEQANLADDWQLDEYPEPRRFSEQLMRILFGSQVRAANLGNDPLTQQLQKFREDLGLLQTLNDPKGIYTRLPFNPRIE